MEAREAPVHLLGEGILPASGAAGFDMTHGDAMAEGRESTAIAGRRGALDQKGIRAEHLVQDRL